MGILATLTVAGARHHFVSRLVGAHNLDNVLLTVGIVHALELDVGAAIDALKRCPGVPGRFERCDGPNDDIVVLVDYAHTPQALERVLRAARALTDSGLSCVFGCGGDRDPDKRAKMGRVVGQLADTSVVTNDNPRSEDPERIAAAIVGGLQPETADFEVVLDRAQAIDRAVRRARPGDVVLIAGKGHEPYQLVGEAVLDFDDRVQARAALARRRHDPEAG
jgi:UDP-N-acetylmuramoyl-L-alanyl-D-glutamate--2,6-diaminopimelate ligase